MKHRARLVRLALCSLSFSLLAGYVPTHAADPAPAKQTAEAGWVTLFDGKTTQGWRGLGRKEFPKGWDVHDGCLHHIPKGGGGDITYDQAFGDFELVFEWKVAPGANSGVKYRVQERPNQTGALGPEYQLIDDARHSDAKASPKRVTGSLYDVYAPKGAQTKPAGEFNEARIVAKGNHIEHWVNGVKVVDVEWGSADWERALSASKFKGNKEFAAPKPGQIVIQDHQDEVWLRNIKVRELK